MRGDRGKNEGVQTQACWLSSKGQNPAWVGMQMGIEALK